jgi:RimJ/RimL family protein N-acetyltransferase
MIIPAKTITLKNGQEVLLRSPEKDEAQVMLDHLKRAFHESYKNMNQGKNHFDNFPVEEERKIIESFALSSEKFMISAFVDHKVIGNLALFGMSAELVKHNARLGMGIEKEYWNLGIGRALLEYAILQARKANFHRLELNVRTFNHSAISLYEKVGFKKIGILKEIAFIDGQYFDEFMYELLID